MKCSQRFRGQVVTLCILLGGAGCSSSGKIRHIKDEITSLRNVNLQQATELESLQISIKKLEGRVEHLEQSSDKVFGKEVSNIKSAIDTLQKRVPPPSIVPEAALEKSLASSDALPEDFSGDFKEALQLIRSGDFAKAQTFLEGILEIESAQKYLPELLFWIGVAYDGQEDFRQSLLIYHRIISEHPKSPLVPAALLRQSILFERMRDVEAAKTVLKNLVNNYPHTLEAEEARIKLAGSHSQ
jgi:TolA-binding protein